MSGLGPELAEALGGEWDDDAETVRGDGPPRWLIWESLIGNVFMEIGTIEPVLKLGRHSDGVAVLAARAREMGVA